MEYRNGPACVPNPASDTPTHEVEGVQMVGGCRVRFFEFGFVRAFLPTVPQVTPSTLLASRATNYSELASS